MPYFITKHNINNRYLIIKVIYTNKGKNKTILYFKLYTQNNFTWVAPGFRLSFLVHCRCFQCHSYCIPYLHGPSSWLNYIIKIIYKKEKVYLIQNQVWSIIMNFILFEENSKFLWMHLNTQNMFFIGFTAIYTLFPQSLSPPTQKIFPYSVTVLRILL